MRYIRVDATHGYYVDGTESQAELAALHAEQVEAIRTNDAAAREAWVQKKRAAYAEPLEPERGGSIRLTLARGFARLLRVG